MGEGGEDGDRGRGPSWRCKDVAGTPWGAGAVESGKPAEKGDQEIRWEGNPASQQAAFKG